MKQFFQWIKSWCTARMHQRISTKDACTNHIGFNKWDFAGRDMTFSQEFWLRSNGLK